MTFVVALTVLAFLEYGKTKRLSAQVNEADKNVEELKRSIKFSEMRLAQYGPKMDYNHQIQLAVEPAIAEFEKVRERYGKVDPKPDKVVVRSVPEYRENDKQTYIQHWRISVPTGRPVFLRSGIRTEINDGADSNLDSYRWLKNTPYRDSNAYEIRLKPGINDLWMSTADLITENSLKLQLGDQQLLSTEYTAESKSRSWSGPSGRKPYSFSLAKKNKSLIEIRFGSEAPRYTYWIWLSSNANADEFEPFPAMPMSKKIRQQKSFEAVADE